MPPATAGGPGVRCLLPALQDLATSSDVSLPTTSSTFLAPLEAKETQEVRYSGCCGKGGAGDSFVINFTWHR